MRARGAAAADVDDDAAPTAFGHEARRRLRAVKQAAEVDAQRAPPGLVAVFQEVLDDTGFMHKGGVVDQDIDRAESTDRSCEKRLDYLSLRDVSALVEYATA